MSLQPQGIAEHKAGEHQTRSHMLLRRPSLRRLTNSDLIGLQNVLSKIARSDAYLQSSSYLAVTGRKGLWLYSTDDTFMLIAAHPNSDDHLLLFPPMGKEPINLLNRVVHDDRIIAGQIQLARISGQDQLLLAWAEASGHFRTGPEKLLDWKYPVHMLSTKAVVEHQGGNYRNFRHGINLANEANLSATLVDTEKDKTTILKLVDIWADSNAQGGYSKDDLTAPTRAILTLMDETELPLHGMIVHKDSQPVGFMTWEETNPEAGIANSMCCLSFKEKGAAEFIYLSMAKILNERGFDYLCIGGSESKGLDSFKRKINPVRSVSLQSAFAIQP